MPEFTFLICSERSGSNLVTRMMNGHAQICGPAPSHLFRLFANNGYRYFPLSNDDNWLAYLDVITGAFENMIGHWQIDVTTEELRENVESRTIAAPVRYLYEKEAGLAGADSIFVKENYAYDLVPFLMSSFPECKFVHQVRDPRDVAASWIKTAGVSGGVERAVETWLRDQAKTLKLSRQLAGSNRLLSIRYEDLISDGAGTLEQLCSHVNLDYDAAMLQFFNNKQVLENAKSIEAWGNLAKPVMKDNAGKYHNVLSPEDIRYVELMCTPLLNEFNYIPDSDHETMSEQQITDEVSMLRPNLSKGVTAKILTTEEKRIREKRLAVINQVIHHEPA